MHVLLSTIYMFATGNLSRVPAAVSQEVHAHVCICGAHVYCVWNGSFQLARLHTFESPWAYVGSSLLVFTKSGCTNHIA